MRNHVLWHLKLFSGLLPVKVFKTLNNRQSNILNKFKGFPSWKSSDPKIIGIKTYLFENLSQKEVVVGCPWNLTNRKNPSKLNYHMSIKKSQAILKHFPLSSFLFPLSSLRFPLSSFLFPDLSRKDQRDSSSRVGCWSFSVLIMLSGSRPEKSSKCQKHGFVFWAQRKPNAKFEIYKVFQDRLTFLNRHMVGILRYVKFIENTGLLVI